MTPDARRKLRELAEKAVSGPWRSNSGSVVSHNHRIADCDWFTDERGARNASYIAAAHPGAMIEVLDDADQWREAVREILGMAGVNPDTDAKTAVLAMRDYCAAARRLATSV